jgi:hypothetical protein
MGFHTLLLEPLIERAIDLEEQASPTPPGKPYNCPLSIGRHSVGRGLHLVVTRRLYSLSRQERLGVRVVRQL